MNPKPVGMSAMVDGLPADWNAIDLPSRTATPDIVYKGVPKPIKYRHLLKGLPLLQGTGDNGKELFELELWYWDRKRWAHREVWRRYSPRLPDLPYDDSPQQRRAINEMLDAERELKDTLDELEAYQNHPADLLVNQAHEAVRVYRARMIGAFKLIGINRPEEITSMDGNVMNVEFRVPMQYVKVMKLARQERMIASGKRIMCCIVAVTDNTGAPRLIPLKVICDEERLEKGTYYDSAKKVMQRLGYVPHLVFDTTALSSHFFALFNWDTALEKEI